MFRLIVVIACLLIIDEYTFHFRRRYIEWRNLQRWQKRMHVLTPQLPESTASPTAISALPPQPGFRHWPLVCLAGLVVAAACGPAAESGHTVAQIAAMAGGVTFWGILLVGWFRRIPRAG